MHHIFKWFKVKVIVIGLIASTINLLPDSYAIADAVDYDIVYVRMPRNGDDTHMRWAEVHTPVNVEPGSDLMLLHPDGSEELLYDAGELGGVADPYISFDGKKVYFSYFEDVADLNTQLEQPTGLPKKGADIYVLDLETKNVKRLTFQEFTPNTGAGNWRCSESGVDTQCDPAIDQQVGNEFHSLGYGVFNTAPVPLAGGKIMFTSNRNGFTPPKTFSPITFQLFVMDEDGSNVTPIAPMTIGSALHPVPLKNGQVMFSSYESQGLRDARLWGVWSINPDGRNWKPLISSFLHPQVLHFSTQLSNGDIVVDDYYNFFNFGFGALYKFPFPTSNEPAFHSAFVNDLNNTPITFTLPSNWDSLAEDQYPGSTRSKTLPFAPIGIESITPFTLGDDYAAPIGADGSRVGKFIHPSAAPANDLLVVWSPGPSHKNGRPTNIPAVDAGIYIIKQGSVISNPADSNFVTVKNDSAYNEIWPRAVVSYQAVYGQPEPDLLDWLPDNTEYPGLLPPGTAYGLVGTSSFYNRESFPGTNKISNNNYDGLEPFNTNLDDPGSTTNSNWISQGSDAGKYNNSDIWAVRIVAMEANSHRRYGPYNNGDSGGTGSHFYNHASEKMRILGEIPLRKFNADGSPVLDPKGDPDTSFLAKITADTPFTFQMLDRNGMVLTTAQTWHQVRPGEARYDCGGCHAHSQQPVLFEQTAAAKTGYQVADLSKSTPILTKSTPEQNPDITQIQSNVVNVEFYQDIRPILTEHCVQCHSGSSPAANLKLDDYTMYSLDNEAPLTEQLHSKSNNDKVPGDYKRLCDDSKSQWGYKPLTGKWRFPNASRYVRTFQSRRSLLAWKVFGERLDGWTNADHPTESVPGDLSTYPEGTSIKAINRADLDYTGTIMPPPDNSVGAAPLSEDQKMTVARWIDLGCPIDTAQQNPTNNNYGWYLDDQRPALHVSLPKAGNNSSTVNLIRIGIADAYKGIKAGSLKISASIVINGRAPGTELSDLLVQNGDGIYTLPVSPSISDVTDAELYVEVADNQTEINPDGNITRVTRKFSVNGSDPDPDPDPDPNLSETVDFETAGAELQLVRLDGKTYQRIAGHGGQVLHVPSNNHNSLLRFHPDGTDYTLTTGTVSVDLNLAYFGGDQYFGSLGSSMGLLLKRWSDPGKITSTNPNGFTNYSVSLQPIGGNIVLKIGANKGDAFAGPAYTYYNETEGHGTRLETNITTYNAVIDNQKHSLDWWNLSATLSENNSGAVEIMVVLTSPNGQQFTETWVDSGENASLSNGLVGLAIHSKWNAGLDFDNFSVSN